MPSRRRPPLGRPMRRPTKRWRKIDSALPVPKQHSMSSIGIGKLPGTETAIRRELNASVPAELGEVLAFYRGELGKRGWKESAERGREAGSGPARLRLSRQAGHAEARPQRRRDHGKSHAKNPGRGDEVGHHRSEER